MADQITLNGITYNVIERRTAADQVAAGHPAIASIMESIGVRFQLVLQRPKGTRLYFVNQYESGNHSKPFAI